MAYGIRIYNRIHKDSPIILTLSRINTIPRIDSYLFNIYSDVISHLRLDFLRGFPVHLPVKFFKVPNLTTYSAHLNNICSHP